MSYLYIDGEWNGYGGKLISFAMVTDDIDIPEREFYETLGCEHPIHWVAENVMPKLGKEPITLGELQKKLEVYLSQFESLIVIADWPEDIARLCDLLVTGPGERINTPPITMKIFRVDPISDMPHNALEDAKALMRLFIDGPF